MGHGRHSDRFRRIWDIALAEHALELGFVLTRDTRQSMTGRPMVQTLDIMFDAADKSGPQRNYEQSAKWLRHRVATLFKLGIPWRPGAQEALKMVVELNIPMALVTNTERILTCLALETIGVEQFIATVCIDDVEHGKPAPDPYLLAAKLIGQPAHDCLAIEDSPTGVVAAQAAGCPILVIPSDISINTGPTLTFRKDLVDLTVAEIAAAATKAPTAASTFRHEGSTATSWKTVELFVSSTLTHGESVENLHAQIRSIAHDAGEFIHDICVGGGVEHSPEWRWWSASYLPGPPTVFEG